LPSRKARPITKEGGFPFLLACEGNPSDDERSPRGLLAGGAPLKEGGESSGTSLFKVPFARKGFERQRLVSLLLEAALPAPSKEGGRASFFQRTLFLLRKRKLFGADVPKGISSYYEDVLL